MGMGNIKNKTAPLSPIGAARTMRGWVEMELMEVNAYDRQFAPGPLQFEVAPESLRPAGPPHSSLSHRGSPHWEQNRHRSRHSRVADPKGFPNRKH